MRLRSVAWSMWVLSSVLVVAAVVFHVLGASAAVDDRDRVPSALLPAVVAAVLAFSTVGALTAARLPRNPIGWIFGLLGASVAAAFLGAGYADYTLLAEPGALPAGELAVWWLSWFYVAPIMTAPALVFLLFPTGRPRSPRWAGVVWAALASAAVAMIGLAFRPGRLDYESPPVQNPVGVEGTAGEVLAGAATAGQAAAFAVLLLAAASMVVRLRGASSDERVQLKWIAYAASLVGLVFVLVAIGPKDGLLADLLWLAAFLAFLGIPMAVGVAILRHRLYDIDLVIRRTLVYGSLTATLAAGYLGCVLLAQLVTGARSDVAIALSTLAMAALFGPARARIQSVVDRRFYRQRYDAARTLESFGGRLRDEIDLEALGADRRGVVRDTVQPAHVSLWLRGER